MTDELDFWYKQIVSSDNRNFSHVINQGLHFIDELLRTGKLPQPYTDRTNYFLRNTVPNIISKGMSICGDRLAQEESPFYQFISLIFQFSISSLYSNESYFFILFYAFNYDPNFADNNKEYVSFVTDKFLTITNRFETVVPAFRLTDVDNNQAYQNVLIDYAVFYYLLRIHDYDEDFVKQTFSITVPSFFALLRKIEAKMLRNVQLFFLITLFNSFYSLFYHEDMKGTEFFPFYHFLKEAIKCEVLDKQLYGCHMFGNIYRSSKNSNFKDVMLQWLFDSDIFNELVHNHPHVEVLKTMGPLFEEMTSKQYLRFDIFVEIWKQSLTAPSADLIIYYNIIVHCIPYFGDQYISSFFEDYVQKVHINHISNTILFYKIFITSLLNTPFANFSLAALGIVESAIFDLPDLKTLVKELIMEQHPDILNKINEMVSDFITKKTFHETIYDITIFLFVNSDKEFKLSFDGNLFFDYVATGVIADIENSSRILEMMSEFLIYFNCKMPLSHMVKLYSSTTRNEIFWNFIFSLTEKNSMNLFEDIDGFCNYVKTSNSENLIFACQSFVFFFRTYYIQFSILVDKSIVKDNNCLWLMKTNEHLLFLFQLFCLLNNETLALNIQEFFLFLIYQSQMGIDELTIFFLTHSFEYIRSDNFDHSERVFKFVLRFIDSIEGRFDFSVFGKFNRLHNSKKLIDVFIPNLSKENSGEEILLRIMPNSDFALRNVISAITQKPLNSIRLINKSKGKKFIEFTEERKDFENIIINQEHFPTIFLSNEQIVFFLLIKLQNDEQYSSIIYKLLNRLLFLCLECDVNLQHYLDAFSVTNNKRPFYFLYMTQRLMHFIQNHMENPNLPFLNECFSLLLNAILRKAYQPNFLKGALNILAMYFDQKLPPESIIILIECSIDRKTTNVKHSLCYLRVAAKLLPDEGININFQTLTKLVKLIDSNEMNDIVIKIISSINNADLLHQLISAMIENPNSYINIYNYVNKLSKEIFIKFPDIQQIVIDRILISCKNIFDKSIIIICNILKAILVVGHCDLTDVIPHLLVDISFHTTDPEIQSAVFELLNEIEDETTNDLIGAILVSLFSGKFSSYDFDPNKYSRIHHSICGLTNLGCTCYMNSILQQVCSVDEVITGLSQSMNDHSLLGDNEELLKLFTNMRFGLDVHCSTTRYCKAYLQSNPSFNPRQQEDAVEYFHTLLGSFPQNTKSLFEGKLKDVFQKDDNNSDSHTILAEHEDLFTTICVSISNITDLVSSLHQFLSPEKLSGNNKYKLESGEKVDALRFTKFVSLPRFLVFQLKRFEYNLVSFERYKVDSMFSFPTTLNMDEFTENGGLYRLKGVVLHIGVAEGGHYISVVKKKNGKWYSCDDTNITEVEEDYFLKNAFGSGQCSAYLLFFEKDDNSRSSDINGENIFEILPENLKIPITDKKTRILECCSLLTQASFNFFKKKIPLDVSILYFFNVLCHSCETNYAVEFSQLLNGCSSFLKEDVVNFLTILNDSVYISTFKAITTLAGKDADVECVQLLLSQSQTLIQNDNLIKGVGIILINVAKRSASDADLFILIYNFLLNQILPSKNSDSIDMTNYFEALSILAPNSNFDVTDVFAYLEKINKNSLSILSFIRFLHNSKTRMEYYELEKMLRSRGFIAIANYLPLSYLTIGEDNVLNKPLFQQIILRIRRNELDAKWVIQEMIFLCMKKSEILLNALKSYPNIVHVFLLHKIKEVRELSEKLVISMFSNLHKQQARYDYAKPNKVNSTKIKNFVDYMIREIPKFVDDNYFIEIYEDNIENDYDNENDDNNNVILGSDCDIYTTFFRTLIWFMSSNVPFNKSSDIFDPLLNLLAKLKKSGNVFDLNVLEITNILSYFNSPPHLLCFAFMIFFENRLTLRCELFPKSLEIFLPQIAFNLNRNILDIKPLLESKAFLRMCKFINSQNYTEIPLFEKFAEIVKSISSIDQHYNERFGEFFV